MEPEGLAQELSVEDRVLLVFGYLGPLALVTLIASRREFVKWHAKQGLVHSGVLIALYAVLRFVHFVFDRYLWAIFGEILRAGLWLGVLGILVMMTVCIVRGLEGERFRIPLVGDLADLL